MWNNIFQNKLTNIIFPEKMNNIKHTNKSNIKPSTVTNIPNKTITFVTCWYTLKSKFPPQKYIAWIKNLLSIVNHFHLVIYTDRISMKILLPLIDNRNNRIKIIIRPIQNFNTYKYKDQWIQNHAASHMALHKVIDWQLNMLWNEKIFFVKDAIENNYFTTDLYGWCDIGYFRNGPDDLHTHFLQTWPRLVNESFTKEVIHYGRVQTNELMYKQLYSEIQGHYKTGSNLPPTNKYDEICFSGGFFILPKTMCNVYAKLYDDKLAYYFANHYFIKDDQLIVMDLIFTHPELFYIHQEKHTIFNNWFMFQRLLL